MFLEQNYSIEKKHLRAFRDVCTSLSFFVFALLFCVIAIILGCRFKSSVYALACFAIAMVPGIFAIRHLRIIDRMAKRSQGFHYEFHEDKAVRYDADGKKTVVPYQSLKILQESDTFLRIASPSCAAILKKDEVTEDDIDALKKAIVNRCPNVKQKNVRGRSSVCEIITAIILAASLIGIAVNLPPLLDSYALAPNRMNCVASVYADKHHIESDNTFANIVYESTNNREAYMYVCNDRHKECPTDCYFVSFHDRNWEVRELLPSEILWEYEADTASFRVLHFEDAFLVEVFCPSALKVDIFSETYRKNCVGVSCNGMAYDKAWIITYSDGIPKDLLIRIGEATYPVGELFWTFNKGGS